LYLSLFFKIRYKTAYPFSYPKWQYPPLSPPPKTTSLILS
jgi:hypothetical protein